MQIKYVAQLFFPEKVQQQPSAALIPDIRQFKDSDHGVAFELPLAVLSFVFTHNDSRAFYFMRHLCNFFVFVLGVYALYTLARWYLRDWRWGLLAAVLLVLSPRFFAEAFYNSKDIVFMACFAMSMATLVYAWQRPTTARILLHALATALAVDVRAQGVLLFLFSLPLLLLANPLATVRQNPLKTATLYVGASLALIVAGWPYLWSLSFAELWQASDKISHYPWSGPVLYLGHVFRVPTEQLPWHYIPVWLFVTTPVTYSLAAGLGIIGAILAITRTQHLPLQRCINLLTLLWLLLPLGIVIVFHPILYNGWRHLYFIYPAFILLAVHGLKLLYQAAKSAALFWRVVAPVLLLITGAEAGYTLWRMAKAHPYENVYFSFLSPQKAEQLFELDYWGLSYREGLEWVLAHDTTQTITFCGKGGYLENNSLLLPVEQRARLLFIPSDTYASPSAKARYFLTAYHYYGGKPQHYPVDPGQEVYTIYADGLRIFSVFRR
ncbi:glycosyltransferase family 39 protein [Hymenobacter citatus]|uniref:glycosyltransferase family 39 protein n=1 Tax=Hymenobacter citatus TaxID=2763506 RepID=UPI001651A0BD|nr:phospholipid carrier-dependent glycosyltransferase [Hymenobacter citatus]